MKNTEVMRVSKHNTSFKVDKDNELMKFLELILLMYIVYMVNVIIHEGGHLIFGLMTGYKFNSFRIFSVILIKQNGKLKIKNISLAGTGGHGICLSTC